MLSDIASQGATAATARSRTGNSSSTPPSAPAGSTSSAPYDEPMPALVFARSDRDRVLAGVCGGLAGRLGVDPTLVRLVFALLALAGGAGILLYLALWVYDSESRTWIAIPLVGLAGAVL